METDTVRLYRAQLEELQKLEAKPNPDSLDETRKAILRSGIRESEMILVKEA